MRRLLVVRAGALGDGLLTLPALAALRTRHPVARITLVGPRPLLPFALAAGLADAALPVEAEAGLALLGGAGPRPAWADADLAVLWLRGWQAAAETARGWGIGTVVGGLSLPGPDDAIHVADALFRPLAFLGLGPSRLARPLAVPAGAEAAAARWWAGQGWPGQRRVVALHPGSGGARKCWPSGRYAELVGRVLRRGEGALLCLGPAEEAAGAAWAALARDHPAVRMAAALPLPLLAGLLRRCAAYVGNDAGVTHLAAALGLPTLALFGPTDPARWAPLGPRVRLLRDLGWQGAAGGEGAWRLTAAEVEATLVSWISAVAGPSLAPSPRAL